jgi:O-antigen/teichoic acid export membrane protein
MIRSKLGRNVLHNVLGATVPLAVSIITVPRNLHAIGDVRYGILALIWLLFGYFGLFDLGLSRSVNNRLSQITAAEPERRETIFDTALAMNAALGTAAGLIFYAVALKCMTLMSSGTAGLPGELREALPFAACLIPFALVGNAYVGRLQADERFGMVNFIQVLSTIGMQVLPLLYVTIAGPTLFVGMAGIITARVLGIGALVLVVRHSRYRQPFSFDWAEGKSLLKFGGWLTITNIISPVLNSIDQFLIGFMMGGASVPHYSIPFSFAQKAQILPAAFSGALFPRFSRLSKEEAKDLVVRSLAILGSVMALICAPAILLADLGLTLWLGPDFAMQSRDVARTILLGTWISGIALIPLCFLQGQGRVDVTAHIHVVELVPFIGILYILIHWLGLTGAAYAWALRAAVDAALVFGAARANAAMLRALSQGLLLVTVSWLVASTTNPAPLTAFIEAIASGVVGLLLVAKAMPDETRRDILKRFAFT